MKKICQSAIYQLLSELDGDVGLYIRDVESDETLEINPNLVLPSASVIKIPMLALLLRDVQEGRVDWKGKRRIAPVNRVGGHRHPLRAERRVYADGRRACYVDDRPE